MDCSVSIDSSVFAGNEGESSLSFDVVEGVPKNIRRCLEKSKESLVLTSQTKRRNPATDGTLNMLFELEKRQYSLVPEDERYLNVVRALHQDPLIDPINWSLIMKHDDYKKFIKKLVFDTAKTLYTTNSEYFKGAFRSTMPVFEALCEPVVDMGLLSKAGAPVRNTLEHAKIDDNGVCNRVVYDRNATRTGRMKVVEGINVLTFPKDSRHIFKSIYKRGAVVSIDFKSIEARVAWMANGNQCEDDDIYSMINEKYFDFKLERSIVKVAVLALLYGQGPEAVAREIGCDVGNAKKFISLIKKKFGVRSVVERLRVQFELEGIIRNVYGRKIIIDEERNIYNSFIQSSAVDVVLFGLLNFLDGLHRDVRPLFIIHDEIYVDCPEHLFSHLSKKLKSVNIELFGMKARLPMKAKIVSKNE